MSPAGVVARFDDPPTPFALEAPAPFELIVEPGDPLDLWLKVFGETDVTLLFDGFAQAARAGLGKGRGRAELTSIVPMWSDDAVDHPANLPARVPAPPPVPPLARVALVSPLRLRVSGGIIEPRAFTAEIWLRALLRRLTLLSALYGDGSSPVLPADIPAIRAVQLWPVPMHRWSGRQRREIDMSGIMGSFILPLSGIEALWPALWVGQWTQVGSATNAGLGAYRLKQP